MPLTGGTDQERCSLQILAFVKHLVHAERSLVRGSEIQQVACIVHLIGYWEGECEHSGCR
jgi:hypothetical protein